MVTSTLGDTTPHIGMRNRPGAGHPPVAKHRSVRGSYAAKPSGGARDFCGGDGCLISPLPAIEHQGDGQYQGTAAARDAVKKALRRAGWVRARRRHTNWPPEWPGCTICDPVVRGYRRPDA